MGKTVSSKKVPQAGKQGLEAADYYHDANGFLVFTEAYHLKRGYCCKNGCRHCPYGFRRETVASDTGPEK